MLQLNHVYITDRNREVLKDCTYRFYENKVYVILGDPDDIISFFDCVAGEKKTDQGQIVTWDGMERFNASDDSLLPDMMTGEEYLAYLSKLSETGLEPEEIMDSAGLSYEETTYLLNMASPDVRAAYRFAAMIASDEYINLFGEPLPDRESVLPLAGRYHALSTPLPAVYFVRQ